MTSAHDDAVEEIAGIGCAHISPVEGLEPTYRWIYDQLEMRVHA
jgi:hypothetical protein